MGKPLGRAGRIRRLVLRGLGTLLVGVLFLVVLLLLAMLTGPTRGLVLKAGVRVADSFVAGDLAVGRVAWPEFGRLAFEDLTWTRDRGGAAPDTLADVARLDLAFDVRALRAREIRIDTLVVRVRNLDLPAVQDVTASGAKGEPGTLAAGGEPGESPLAEGSLPGIPSVAVEHLDVQLDRGRVAPELVLSDLAVLAAAEAGRGRQPFVRVRHAAGRLAGVVTDSTGRREVAASLVHLGLGASVDTTSLAGGDLLRASADLDSLNLVVEEVKAGGMAELGRLELQGAGRLEDGGRTSADLDSLRLVVEAMDAGDLVAFARLELWGAGRLETGDGTSAVLDSLSLVLDGAASGGLAAVEHLALAGQGRLGQDGRGTFALDLAATGIRGGPAGAPAAWSADPLALSLEARADVPSLLAGNPLGMVAAIDRLAVRSARVARGDDLEILDLDLDARGGAGGDGTATLTVRNLDAVVKGVLADSTQVRPWGLELDHLGMGAAVALDTTASGVLRLKEARLDSLFLDLAPVGPIADQAGWQPEAELRFDVAGGVARHGGDFEGDLGVEFILPGTSHFPRLMPTDFPHEAFGAVAGSVEVTAATTGRRLVGDALIDLERTAWLEAGRMGLHLDADLDSLAAGRLSDVVALADSFTLGLEGIALFLDGGLDRGDLDLDFMLGIDDLTLGRLFVPAIGESDTLEIAADLRVGGTVDEPLVNGSVAGGARVLSYRVPEFRVDLEGDETRVGVDLWAGGGLVIGSTRIDSVSAGVQGLYESEQDMEAGFALDVWAGRSEVILGGYAFWDTTRTVRIDSFGIRSPVRSMALQDPVTLTIGPGPGDFSLSPMALDGEAGTIEMEGSRRNAEIMGRLLADFLLSEELLQTVAPSPVWAMDGGQDLAVEADVTVGGEGDAPLFAGSSRVRLMPHRNKPSLGLDLDLEAGAGEDGGLTAILGVLYADTVMVQGTTTLPGTVDLATGAWRPDPDREATLDIPAQSMMLSRFNRLLPEDVRLSGNGELSAMAGLPLRKTADGTPPLDKGRLEAGFRTTDLEVKLPNRSRIDLDIDLRAEGNLADPMVKGTIAIGSAFFRIPEIPRNLHPIEGPSLLWALRDSVAARLDSTKVLADTFEVFATPERDGPAVGPKGPGYLPQLDLRITMPSKVRINGYGMDIELEGDFHVARGFDEDGRPGPSLSGKLRVRQGTLQFMNRVFKPHRGNIDFTGSIPPDPRLDLMLEADVSGTTVRILVSGRSSNPVIDLTSEPEMPEEDVMAVLLFGRPLNDLDMDQRGSMDDGADPAKELRENLAGLAMVFGTAGLQNQMSNTLGVDMVQLGSDSSGGSTLMVGKFISPELMVKYHASLEKSGQYFMTLEYTLSRYFKVVSTYGQGDEASGAEVQWSKRY